MQTEKILNLVHIYRTDTKGRPLTKQVPERVYKLFPSVVHENQTYEKAGWQIAPKTAKVETPAEAVIPESKPAHKAAQKRQPAAAPEDFDPNIPELP